jgi:hypothetical protein
MSELLLVCMLKIEDAYQLSAGSLYYSEIGYFWGRFASCHRVGLRLWTDAAGAVINTWSVRY